MNQHNRLFAEEVVEAIRAKCPSAVIIENLRLDPRGIGAEVNIDLVVFTPPAIYILEIKDWHGVVTTGSPGLLHVIDECGTHHVTPDLRALMRHTFSPLIAYRNLLVHGHGQETDKVHEPLFDHCLPILAVIVPDDLGLLSQEAKQAPVSFLHLTDFLNGLRAGEGGLDVSVGGVTAWLQRRMSQDVLRREDNRLHNPFTMSGMPLTGRSGEPAYVAREAQLSTVLGALDRGDSVTVLAPRRYGKTTFLFALREILNKRGTPAAYVSAEGVSEWSRDRDGSSGCPILPSELPHNSVLLVDEADFVFQHPEAAFRLRDMICARELRVVFAAVSLEVQPSVVSCSSPIQSMTMNVRIPPLDAGEVRSLYEPYFGAAELEQIVSASVEYVGGNPNLTQMFGYHLFESGASRLGERLDEARSALHAQQTWSSGYFRSLSREFVEFLLSTDLSAAEIPRKLYSEANDLVTMGLFRWSGWRLEPVGRFALESLLQSVPQNELIALNQAASDDIWPGIYDALLKVFPDEDLRSMFEVPKDQPQLINNESELRNFMREQLGLRDSSSVIRELLGHRERRRLAQALHIEEPDATALPDTLLTHFRKGNRL